MEHKYNKDIVHLAKQLRKNQSKEERHLWYDFLRDYPIRFTRQKVLYRYIADFYCAKAKLVIELDGSQRFEQIVVQNDEFRTEYLENHGLKVLRITNDKINNDSVNVCNYIDSIVRQNVDIDYAYITDHLRKG